MGNESSQRADQTPSATERPEETGLLEEKWKPEPKWDESEVDSLKTKITTQGPVNQNDVHVEYFRVLLVGQVGAGKSGFVNSVKSIFVERLARGDEKSLTTAFKMHEVRLTPGDRNPLPWRICDTKGLRAGHGPEAIDLIYLVNGHVPDRTQLEVKFIAPDDDRFQKNPSLGDKAHCVAFVIDAKAAEYMECKIWATFRKTLTLLNEKAVPVVVLLTKIDMCCQHVKKDVTKVFYSKKVRDIVKDVSWKLNGLPENRIFPIKNYEKETELEHPKSILILKALRQMLWFAQGYLDEMVGFSSRGGGRRAVEHRHFSPRKIEDGFSSKNSTVPIEIQARGPEALRAYQKALKYGKTRDCRVPVMIVGQDRSGKTSLKKSLKGEKFDSGENSTIGIEVDPSLCQLTTEVWRPKERVESTDVKFDRDAARLTRKNLTEGQSHKKTQEEQWKKSDVKDNKVATRTLTGNTKARPDPQRKREGGNHKLLARKSGDSVLPQRRSRRYAAFPESQSKRISTLPIATAKKSSYPELNFISTLPKEIEKELLNLKSENLEIDKDPEFVLWDFAGQPVFYTTHVLFMSRIAIYILTHDLSRDLHAKAEPSVKCDMYERVLTDKECELTNMDYIHYWLSSIHAFSSNSESSSSESEDLPSKLPAVFLVGTHADECKNSREVAMEILSNLEGKSYEGHVVQEQDPFTVDNTKSGSQEGEDEVFKRLRDKLLKAAYQLRHMKELIPLKWFLLEKLLKSLNTNLTSLETARATAKKKCDIQDENEFRVVITYLHDRHAVLHFSDTPELDRLVVLNHQWLIDIFKKIITVQPQPTQKPSFRPHWKALETQGVLNRELVVHVWKDLITKEEITGLLQLLQKFSLACRWTQQDGSEVYLVPSMLMTAADSKVLELIASAEVPALIVQFPDEYVPFGLFPRLVTRCVNWCAEKWTAREQPQFFRNYARFFLGDSGTYQVILASRMNVVAFSVVRGETVSMCYEELLNHKRELTKFCRAVIGFLKQTLEAMQEEHVWLKFMRYIICVQCPVCSKGGVRSSVCDRHQVAGCKQDQCVHYIPEDKLVRDHKPLVCCKSGDAMDTSSSKEPFTPWFQALDSKASEPSDVVLSSSQVGASQISLEASQVVLSQHQASASQANSSAQPAQSSKHVLLSGQTRGWSEESGLSQVTTETAKQFANIDKASEPSDVVLSSSQAGASQTSLEASQVVLPQHQASASQANSSVQPAQSNSKHVLMLGQTWGWSEESGLSQVTTEIAKHFATIDKVQATFLVIESAKDQQDQARKDGINLVRAPYKDLSCLPDDVRDVDVVVSCGKAIGPPARTVKNWCKCSWTHISCSSSEENVDEETNLCESSNVAVGLGSNVAEACARKLRLIQKEVSEFIPGIFEELQVCTQGPTEGKTFSVLAFYPPLDEASASKKIYEIPAKAVGLLPDGRYKFRLFARCSPHSEPEELKEILYKQGITPRQLIVRSHCPNIESCRRLLTEVDLLILPFLPSRSEDFGLVALQAISAGLPVLVSSTTGLGDALRDVTNGGAFIVNSDDPEEWKKRILAVKEKERNLRLTEANLLRENYNEKYSWEEQCKDLWERILSEAFTVPPSQFR